MHVYLQRFDSSDNLLETEIIGSLTLVTIQKVGSFYQNSAGANINYQHTFNCDAGDYFIVSWRAIYVTPNVEIYSEATYSITALIIHFDVRTVLPTIEIPALTVMDLFEKIIQKIDPTASVDSDYFGALPENNTMLFTSGDAIRGISNPTIKVKLSEFFDSISAIHGVGMGISNGVARLEKLTYFYDASSGLNFGNVIELTTSNALQLMPKTLEVGYETNEYGELNGRDEYNAAQQWVLPYTTISDSMNSKSIYRADMYGIDNLRISLYGDTENTDNKADNEVFIIDGEYSAQVAGVRYYIVSRSKYTYINGLENPDTSYNMVYSPRSCLMRNTEKIAAALWKLSGNIELTSYDKNVLLEYAMGVTIYYEQNSISGGAGLFAPIYAEFQIVQKTGLWASLVENARKKCSFEYNGGVLYGYIVDAAVNIDHREVISVRVLLDINNDFTLLT